MKVHNRGFSLVELMITVAIAAILAMISYPSYLSYVRRANRVDATAALMRVASAQEKFFVQNNTYADDTQMKALGLNTSEHGWYSITITGAALTSGFTATAEALSGKKQDADEDCRQFTYTSTGDKKAYKADKSDNSSSCWR